VFQHNGGAVWLYRSLGFVWRRLRGLLERWLGMG